MQCAFRPAPGGLIYCVLIVAIAAQTLVQQHPRLLLPMAAPLPISDEEQDRRVQARLE